MTNKLMRAAALVSDAKWLPHAITFPLADEKSMGVDRVAPITVHTETNTQTETPHE